MTEIMCNDKVMKYNTNGGLAPYPGWSLLGSESFNSLINSNQINIYDRIVLLTQILFTINVS